MPHREPSPLDRRIYALVRAVPRGRVISYGGVAAALGRPRAPRAVGSALRRLPDGHDVPWWRVINAAGRISTPGIHHTDTIQRTLLEGEGVEFSAGGTVSWGRFGWSPTAPDVERVVAGLPPVPEVGRR